MSNDATNFSEARTRLEDIVKQVRSKDVSLEKSLDLFDEAIKVGNSCFEYIDQVDFTEEELRGEGSIDDQGSGESATDGDREITSEANIEDAEPEQNEEEVPQKEDLVKEENEEA